MKSFSIGLMLPVLLAIPLAGQGEEIACRPIHEALRKVSGEFEHCHLVLANRGSSDSIGVGATTPRIAFFDVWMVGDHVQVLEVTGGAGGSKPWWDGFSGLTRPLRTENLLEIDGYKMCARAKGEILWADFLVLPVGRRLQYPSLYSTSRSMKPVGGLFVPFLESNRGWSKPFAGGWPLANFVAEVEPSKWRTMGRELVDGARTVRVEIARQEMVQIPLKRHEGTLGITPLWVGWFSEDRGYLPLKIESSVRYMYLGREYPYERPAGMEPLSVYRAGDIGRPVDDVWFPMSGSQRTYLPDPKDNRPFDADRLVEAITLKGKYVDTQKYVLSTEREWRVLKLERVAPDLETWFDPPNGSGLRDFETKSFRIVGKSEVDSKKQLLIDEARVGRFPQVDKFRSKITPR